MLMTCSKFTAVLLKGVMNTKELLIAGKTNIKQRGWGRKKYIADSGEVCMMGAMHVALNGVKEGILEQNKNLEEATNLLARCINKDYENIESNTYGRSINKVLNFNDKYAIGVNDVLEVYTCAIERCDEATTEETQSKG